MRDERSGRSSLLLLWLLQYVPFVFLALASHDLRCLQGLTRYAPIWPSYLREFFRSSIEDGISYIETRVNFMEYQGEK